MSERVLQRVAQLAGPATGLLALEMSLPDGTRCFYYFPGTEVASSDARSFTLRPYAVDATMCGDRIVWIGRDLVEQQQPLAAGDRATP
jgi:hypothetical protein